MDQVGVRAVQRAAVGRSTGFLGRPRGLAMLRSFARVRPGGKGCFNPAASSRAAASTTTTQTTGADVVKQHEQDPTKNWSLPLKVHVGKGSGYRSSFNGVTATVFGATGFLGRYLCQILGRQGTELCIPYRSEEYYARHLKVAADLGQVHLKFCETSNEKQLKESIAHSDVVINLIGREYSTSQFPMNIPNEEIPRRIAKACRELNVPRLIHMSTNGADLASPSEYYRTKAAGEVAVKEEFPEATIVRSTNIWGDFDKFINRFLVMARPYQKFPGARPLYLVNHGRQITYPIYAGDVARGLARLIREEASVGKTYQFHGARKFAFEEIVDLLIYYAFLDSPKMSTSTFYFFLREFYFRDVQTPLFTWDQCKRLSIDETIHPTQPSLHDLGFNVSSGGLEDFESSAMKYFRYARRGSDPLNYEDFAYLPPPYLGLGSQVYPNEGMDLSTPH